MKSFQAYLEDSPWGQDPNLKLQILSVFLSIAKLFQRVSVSKELHMDDLCRLASRPKLATGCFGL